MIFAILTLLSALSLAAVSGWFSIVGFMAIYAGAPIAALIMGAVTECAKIMTTSWLYRNWSYTSWRLKIPLLYFLAALMVATSIGVFGFLSKAHLEQGAGTLDNTGKIEDLARRIDREKALIADNEKVIAQLDATVNSFLGKDRIDRSLAVRRAQAPQRKQLTQDSVEAQKRIDELSAEKFKLESEIRKLELDVGPIRYIADLFFGTGGDANANIESAVRIFTLLIVSTLDPLAVTLIIAANATLVRLRDEKNKKETTTVLPEDPPPTFKEPDNKPFDYEEFEGDWKNDLYEEVEPPRYKTATVSQEVSNQRDNTVNEKEEADLEVTNAPQLHTEGPVVLQDTQKNEEPTTTQEPIDTQIEPEVQEAPIVRPWAHQERVMHELVGHRKHFVPEKVIPPVEVVSLNSKVNRQESNKYYKARSWLTEFKGL